MKSRSASSDIHVDREIENGNVGATPMTEMREGVKVTVMGPSCDPNDPECEACQ